MALCCTNVTNKISRPLLVAILTRLYSEKVISLESQDGIDVLDRFTTKLTKEKAIKWSSVHMKQPPKFTSTCLCKKDKDINSNANESLDNTLSLLIQNDDEESILNFIKTCQKNDVCPSVTKILYFLESKRHSVRVILQLKELVKNQAVDFYRNNGSLNHYLAEAYWTNGEIIKAVDLIEPVYANHIYLRRRLRLMLKCLVMDITNTSEASLMTVIKFAEDISNNYKDSFILATIWQNCFLSEWFCDQKLSMDLLKRNQQLRAELNNLIPYVVTKALRQHQVDVVYRLLEVLLKYSIDQHYAYVLISLFDYKYVNGDLKSCLEIIQWSKTYNVQLPQEINQNFLRLLVNSGNKDDNIKVSKMDPKPNVKLKF